MKDYLLNRIWEEMKQINTNMYYAEVVMDKQTKRGKYKNFVIAVFSTGGAALSLVNILFPAIASVIVAGMAIVTQFFQFDDGDKLCRLHTDCTVYFNRLQDLFLLLNFDKIDAKKALARFDVLLESNAGRQTEIGRIFGKINKKTEVVAKQKSKTYLDRIYNNSAN
jgi:hypothetical protein